MSRQDNQDFEELSKLGKCVTITQMRERMSEKDSVSQFMFWNLETGEYEPAGCEDCLYPKLAHSDDFCWGLNKKRNPGTSAKTGWTEDSIMKMNNIILNDDLIKTEVDKQDSRPHKTACTCGRQFMTRMELKEHELFKHNRNLHQQINHQSKTQQQTIQNQVQPQVLVHLTDPPKVPKWDREDFETFEARIGDWSKRTQEDKGAQYQKLIDSLKENEKKKGVSDFVTTKILENSDHERTVEAVLRTLREKYGKNKKERFDEIIDLIKDSKWKKEDSHEDFVDNMKKLERKWKKEQIEKHSEYFLYRVMMKAGAENIDVYMREQLDEKVEETRNKNDIMKNVFERLKKYKTTEKEQKLRG